MGNWKDRALSVLKNSLLPVPTELNELDWKSGLSPKTDRLAQHLCAFANISGGGFLVFGINNDGSLFSVSSQDVEDIVKKLGNIAKNNLNISITIEHCCTNFEGHHLLIVHVPEQQEKPIYLRGSDVYNAFTRSAGQTVKMSKRQAQILIAHSQDIPFEEMIALSNLSDQEVFDKLNFQKLFELIDQNTPKNTVAVLNALKQYGFIKESRDLFHITNLGAILLAKNINDFQALKGRCVIVRKYIGTNNRDIKNQQIGRLGYAAGFIGLLDYIMKELREEEIIEEKRNYRPTYPKIAIKEFVANALIHQDFTISGMPITIEIFQNRLEITNPGAPLNDVNRLIDLPPISRNEILAQTMLLLNLCERRGSGIDRAVEAIEKDKLPPVKFEKGETYTRITLSPKKELKEMSKTEKINACYQHTCILYQDKKELNNQSLRERFGLDKNNSAIASRIITDTFETGLIKLANPEISSRKYATYIPYYA